MGCSKILSVGTVNCWDGCYAEYMQMPERHCFHLPEELSMDEGALIEPASIAYDAFRGVTLTEKDTVVVYGTGAIGMISAWLAKYYGAGRVILVGRTEEKLQVALQIGADFVINSRKEDAIAAVKKLSADVGIPADLKEILKEEDVQFLSESAFADACRPGNPKDTSVEEIAELYRALL